MPKLCARPSKGGLPDLNAARLAERSPVRSAPPAVRLVERLVGEEREMVTATYSLGRHALHGISGMTKDEKGSA